MIYISPSIQLHTVIVECSHIYYLIYMLQDKRTALHYGAKQGHAPVVEGLIRAGADVNAVDFVS